MANVIYRGPIKDEPKPFRQDGCGRVPSGHSRNRKRNCLTVATGSNIEDDLCILSTADFSGQDVATALRPAGDTGVAYRPRPGEVYQVRLAGATYAKGDGLTVGASGYLETAASGERVLAFSRHRWCRHCWP